MMAAPACIPTKSVGKFPFLYLHPLQHLLCVYFDHGHSGWSNTVPYIVLICVSLIICDVEHLSIWLLAICISSLEKCISVIFLIFNWVIWFLLWFSCMSCLYVLECHPLSVASFENIFCHSVDCLFILFMVSFAVQKLVSLIRSYWFIFAFISVAFEDWPKNVLHVFSSRDFIELYPFARTQPVVPLPFVEKTILFFLLG